MLYSTTCLFLELTARSNLTAWLFKNACGGSIFFVDLIFRRVSRNYLGSGNWRKKKPLQCFLVCLGVSDNSSLPLKLRKCRSVWRLVAASCVTDWAKEEVNLNGRGELPFKRPHASISVGCSLAGDNADDADSREIRAKNAASKLIAPASPARLPPPPPPSQQVLLTTSAAPDPWAARRETTASTGVRWKARWHSQQTFTPTLG